MTAYLVGPDMNDGSHTLAHAAPRIAILSLLLTCSTNLACGSKSQRPAPAEPPPVAKESCSLDVPTYESATKRLFKHYCLQCHRQGGAAGEDYDFERFETLFAQRRQIEGVLRNRVMPPNGLPQPTDSESALMIRWASCGAPRS